MTDALRAMVGEECVYPAQEEIGRAMIRYFAIAVGDPNPLYVDDAYARAHGHPSRIAPPTFIVESGQYAGNAPNAAGYLPHEWDFPVEDMRTIRGGQDYEFFRPVLPDDEISATYALESIEEKSSRDGRGQLMAVSLATYRDAHGATVATNREIFFLQPLGPEAAR